MKVFSIRPKEVTYTVYDIEDEDGMLYLIGEPNQTLAQVQRIVDHLNNRQLVDRARNYPQQKEHTHIYNEGKRPEHIVVTFSYDASTKYGCTICGAEWERNYETH